MSSTSNTAHFFTNGNSKQYEYVLSLYHQVLRLKAESKNKKPEELVKLDDWFHNELPKLIKSRGKDAHMIHEELVQTMKWKQTRGKFYPQLNYLIKVNTPRAVMMETKKAFRKLPNLEQAMAALSNLKGVGTTMASALLAAASPENAPFMADECLMAIPDIEGIDYTTKEYLNFVTHIQAACDRLNKEKDSNTSWSAHRVELALWTHYVANELKPELLEGLPSYTSNLHSSVSITAGGDDNDADDLEQKQQNNENNDHTNNTSSPSNAVLDGIDANDSSSLPEAETETAAVTATAALTTNTITTNGVPPSIEASDESNLEPACQPPQPTNGNNGVIDSLDESSTRSEDSCEKVITPIGVSDEATNDSDSQNSIKRSLDGDTTTNDEPLETNEPEPKKIKVGDE